MRADALAERLFSKFFTADELAHLKQQPQFIGATERIDTELQALGAVELGCELIKKLERTAAYEGSRREFQRARHD